MGEDLKYWIWFGCLIGLKYQKRLELLKQFDAPVNIWFASKREISATGIITDSEMGELMSKALRAEAGRYLERIYKHKIKLVTILDEGYPRYLKEIHHPPMVLFVKGKFLREDKCIAIVGSRKATSYGLSMAELLSYELAKRGITVVSGMARGVDSHAHRGALKACGRTIAVLGCGLDKVYPPENEELMQKISQTGAAVSEYLPGVGPRPLHFPARNRIISGMSLGTVVIEAGEKSGSLITADFALEQGREVFAVPGNIDSRSSAGSNRLIREGAKIVTGVDDILEELINHFEPGDNIKVKLPLSFPQESNIPMHDLDDEERAVVEHMKEGTVHIDALAVRLGLNVQYIAATLVMLELKGVVEQLPGKMFRLKKQNFVDNI